MKPGTVATCLGLVALLSASSASAHTTEIESGVRIVHEDVFEPPAHSVVGDLSGTPQKCLDNRRVRIYFDYAHEPVEWTLVDVARSGASGGWAGSGFMNNQFGFVSSIKAKVMAKNVGPAGHRHVCGRAVTIAITGTG